MKILADRVIACPLIFLGILGDAPGNGINPWPYLPLIVITGSSGALLCLRHRAVVQRSALYSTH